MKHMFHCMRGRLSTPLAAFAVVLCAGACSGADTAAPARVFVDGALQQRVMRLGWITDDSVVALQESGKQVVFSRSELLAIMPEIAHAAVTPAGTEIKVWRDPSLKDSQPLGRCDLIDGAVLPGLVWPEGSQGEHVGWDSRLWGRISLPIESIRQISLRPLAVGERAGIKDDVVWLVNADRTAGFVSSVGEDVTVEVDGKPAKIALSRVAGIGFSNKPVAPQGQWIWLYDGTATGVSGLRVARDGASQAVAAFPGATKQPVSKLSSDEIRAVLFDASRLAPLASCAIRSAAPSGLRRWTPAPIVADSRSAPLGAADIEFPGPMSSEWELPAGASRVCGLAELPAACRAWGDCEVFIELIVGEQVRPLWHRRVNAGEPEAAFNVLTEAAGATSRLRIRIEPGENGPIQDRVIIRRGMILVAPSPK